MSEYAECYTEKTPKARTRHRCCECNGHIEIGETYHVFSGIFEGAPFRQKTCSDCHREWELLASKLPRDEIPSFESLYEEIHYAPREDFLRMIEIKRKRGAKLSRYDLERLESEEGVKL